VVDEGWGRKAVDFATLSDPGNGREFIERIAAMPRPKSRRQRGNRRPRTHMQAFDLLLFLLQFPQISKS
jgi:hypothetical protein